MRLMLIYEAYLGTTWLMLLASSIQSGTPRVDQRVFGTGSRKRHCTVIGASLSHDAKSASPAEMNGATAWLVRLLGRTKRWTCTPIAL